MLSILRAEGNGLTSADTVNGPTLLIVTSFISLAFYNVLELSVFIYTTFKRRKGLYFWSMVIATWGIALNGSGYIIKFVEPVESPSLRTFSTVLVLLGWCTMTTGQSVVLFSRLHLLVSDRFKIRLVLTMIMIDAAICHPPTFALFALVQSANPEPYAAAYSIYEKFQLLVFFIQELIISIIYIMESAKFLRVRATISRTPSIDRKAIYVDSRTVMRWLIAVNVLVVFLDISILAFEFSGFYDLQTSWVSTYIVVSPKRCSCIGREVNKVLLDEFPRVSLTIISEQKCLVYSIKLKLEFSILNKLIGVVKARNPDLFNSDGLQMDVLGGNKASATQSIQNIQSKEVDVNSILPIQPNQEDTFRIAEGGPALMRTKEQNSLRLPPVLRRQDKSMQGPDVNIAP